MRIITNNKPRHLIYGYELTEKEKTDFDYLGDIDSENFVRYQGMIIHTGEFMRLSDDCEEYKQGWHGILTDSYFSAIVIKWADDDFESVVVGRMSC